MERAVARVSAPLSSNLPEGSFVTVAIAALDPDKQEGHLFPAGHGLIVGNTSRDVDVAAEGGIVTARVHTGGYGLDCLDH